MKVLVTGGAGFIGSHLVDELLQQGYDVRVLDSLISQVHGDLERPPDYLDSAAEFVRADIRDRTVVANALEGVTAVMHHAAAVGVGQSMYEVAEYCDVNVMGTAILLEETLKRRDHIERVIVASSMSNYGEGRYRTAGGELRAPAPRSLAQLQAGEWELREVNEVERLVPVATDEGKPLAPTSVYATTKRDQEELVLNICRAYDIPAVALRYFNVYGPRQALSNPYTGVAAIFCARLLRGERPVLFEDGLQTRDFVHVSDIVRANVLALESAETPGLVLNVGSGAPVNLIELSQLLAAEIVGADTVEPEVSGRFREGDIRHCFADISLIQDRLGYVPRVQFADGVGELCEWVRGQSPHGAPDALAELVARRLVR